MSARVGGDRGAGMRAGGISRRLALLWALLAAAGGTGGAGCASPPEPMEGSFAAPAPPRPFSPAETLRQFDAVTVEPYRLGEGDQLALQVWEKPELSGAHVIGPDGIVSIPLIGSVRVAGLTREEAAKTIQDGLSRLYTGISVTLRVDQYLSNHVTILGRVKTPGAIRFEGVPTLLELIARAGGILEIPATPSPNSLPVNLTHLAVIRGHDRVAWIDLNSLVDGRDLSLNLRLRPNDLVLVPEDGDLPVYVLGQVLKPGPYRWTRGMTFMDALALAGGLTRDAIPTGIVLVRPSQGTRLIISQSDLIAPVEGTNVALQKGDILYAPTSVLADVGYILQQLNAFSWIFIAQQVRH